MDEVRTSHSITFPSLRLSLSHVHSGSSICTSISTPPHAFRQSTHIQFHRVSLQFRLVSSRDASTSYSTTTATRKRHASQLSWDLPPLPCRKLVMIRREPPSIIRAATTPHAFRMYPSCPCMVSLLFAVGSCVGSRRPPELDGRKGRHGQGPFVQVRIGKCGCTYTRGVSRAVLQACYVRANMCPAILGVVQPNHHC